jgi:hypothetical protein
MAGGSRIDRYSCQPSLNIPVKKIFSGNARQFSGVEAVVLLR